MYNPDMTESETGKGFDAPEIFQRCSQDPSLCTLSQTSKELIRTDPISWAVGRKRLVTASLLNGDEVTFQLVCGEYIALLGPDYAFAKILSIMEEMSQTLEE